MSYTRRKREVRTIHIEFSEVSFKYVSFSFPFWGELRHLSQTSGHGSGSSIHPPSSPHYDFYIHAQIEFRYV